MSVLPLRTALAVLLLYAVNTKASDLYINITHTALRINETFNLTVGGLNASSYKFDFGDSNTYKFSDMSEVVKHSYQSPGKYTIKLNSTSPVGVASLEVNVQEALKNLTLPLNPIFCAIGQQINLSVNVIPNIPATITFLVQWESNNQILMNWTTTAAFTCTQLGNYTLTAMAGNGVSVATIKCASAIKAFALNISASSLIVAPNETIEFRRSDLDGNYSYTWQFEIGGATLNSSNLTLKHSYASKENVRAEVATLRAFAPDGQYLEAVVEIWVYNPIVKPLKVVYSKHVAPRLLFTFTAQNQGGHNITYIWDFGDNSSTSNSGSHVYQKAGTYCVKLVAKNQVSEAHLSFTVKAITAVEGLNFIQPIKPVALGSVAKMGIEILNGSSVNVSVSFGDNSPPATITEIDSVMDLFVISAWHNYTSVGEYNVTVTARNTYNSITKSMMVVVEYPISNLTLKVTHDSPAIEVNSTVNFHVQLNGSNPTFSYEFGDDSIINGSHATHVIHSYVTQGVYRVRVTAWNNVSRVTNNASVVTVVKPVLLLKDLALVSSPSATNLSYPKTFILTLSIGSDFRCTFDMGNGEIIQRLPDCYNVTYYKDGITSDTTPFRNLRFEFQHNYTYVGNYEVKTFCTNRLSNASHVTYTIVQRPIAGFHLPAVTPQILGNSFSLPWNLSQGTNVTFTVEVNNVEVNSVVKTDEGGRYTITRANYQSEGVHEIKLLATNFVSNTTGTISVIIQAAVATIFINTEVIQSDFGNGMTGFGPEENIFPAEYEIRFTADVDKGTNLTYNWQFGNNSQQNTTENITTYKFNPENVQKYIVQVTGYNLVSSATNSTTVKTEKSVRSLRLSNDSPTKVNSSTTFELNLAAFGTDTCFTLDLGDGTPWRLLGGQQCNVIKDSPERKKIFEPIDESTLIRVTHVYRRVGEFKVRVNASNKVSHQSSDDKAVTLALSCEYPNVTMKDVGKNSTFAKKIKRSQSFTLTNAVVINCEASKSTSFLWEAYRVGNKTSVQLKNNLSSELFVPERSLDYGVYKIKATVTMEGVGVSTSDTGFIEIVNTPYLIAKMDASFVKRAWGKNITLDARSSFDPDYGENDHTNMEFNWLCRLSSEPEFNLANLSAIQTVALPNESNTSDMTNKSGCFGTGAGRLIMTGPLVLLDTRIGMIENLTYVFDLVIVKTNQFGKKSGTFQHQVELTFGDPPVLSLRCQQNCKRKVNIDQLLAIEGICKECYGPLTFRWELTKHKIGSDNKIPDKNFSDMLYTKFDYFNMVMRPNQLKENANYTLSFKAFRTSGLYGEIRFNIITNSPPGKGLCDISPRNGLALNTTFRFTCTGWKDPDPELRYEFASRSGDMTSTFYSDKEPFTKSVLPLGSAENNFTLTIIFRVIDGLSALTERTITIKVRPLSESGKSSFLALSQVIMGKDSKLKHLIQEGDLQSVNQLITSASSLLNFDSKNVDPDRNVSQTEENQIQEDKKNRMEMRSLMIKDLEGIQPTSMRIVKLLAPSYDSTTVVYEEIDDKSQERSLQAFEKMTDVVKQASRNKAKANEITEGASSIMSTVGNVIMASGLHAREGINDTKVNISTLTDGKTNNSGLVSAKKRAKERTLKGYNLLKNLSRVIIANSVAGCPVKTIHTKNSNVSLERVSIKSLGNSTLSDNHTSVTLPSLAAMGLQISENTTTKYRPIDKIMIAFPKNPFTWSKTSQQANSFVISFVLEDRTGYAINTSYFKNYASIFVPRDDRNIPPPQSFYSRPLGDGNGGQIQYHSFNVTSSFSMHVQIKPLNNSHSYVVYIKFKQRPTTTDFDYKGALPDLSSCAMANKTNGTKSGEDVIHVHAEKDCQRDPYTVFISNEETKTGLYYIGVYYEPPKTPQPVDPTMPSTKSPERKRRAIPCGEHGGRTRRSSSCVIIPSPPPKPTTQDPNYEGTRAPNVDFKGNQFNINESSHYSIRSYSSNCLFWDADDNTWLNTGCKVGEKTTTKKVHCKCNHLTDFASDFVVAPNPIDFDKVFSADLSNNFVVITVVCLLFGIYIVLALWCRRADQRDLEKLGATAVGRLSDQGFSYRVSIHTGLRENSGTTANVYLVLSGNKYESPPVSLVDSDRKIFQRGQDNSFVTTYENDLGTLNHIRIWHDNSGRNPSWYLSRIKVEKINTPETWYFICERWLAVEEDDGRVDRILPVASKKELTHFQHLFVSKTVKEFGDGHLWFSIVARPPTSPFTRLQRLSCCLSLLCCTMITNAMFYDIGDDSTKSNYVIIIGSLTIDYRALIIGVQSSLIIFPVNLALVQIFRNARPKGTKTTPQAQLNTGYMKDDDQQSEYNVSISNVSIHQKKKKGIPHCWVYFGWVLCLASSITSAVFTVFYSLSWGPEIANEWLLTFVLSFCQSVLIIQPVKVVFAAIFFALVIKKPVAQEEGESEKNLDKKTPKEETAAEAIFELDEEVRYRPPNENFLKEAREKRLKEIAMSSIIKEVLTYFIFYIVLLLVAYGNRDSNSFLLRKSLHETFVDLDDTMVDLSEAEDVDLMWHWSRETLVPGLYPGVLYNNQSDKYKGFIDDRYNYLVGISRLRQVRIKKDSCKVAEEFKQYFNNCYTGYDVSSEEQGNYDVGWKELKKDANPSRRRRSTAEQFFFVDEKTVLLEYGETSHPRRRRAIEPVYTSTSGRQKRKKRPRGQSKVYFVLDSAVLPDGSIISCPTRWLYHDMFQLRGYPFWGRLSMYNGGGYPADLGYDYATAMTVIADLHSHNWIDAESRSVFVEFTVYNANVNLFGVAYLFIEFLPTGGALPYGQFSIARLYNYLGPYSNFLLALEVLVVLFMIYFMYREGKAMYKQGRKYFKGFWNWLEVVMIILEFAAFALFFARLWEVDKNLIELHHNPKDFVSFQYAAAADEVLSYVIGILVFLVNLRFIKLLRFNRRMALLGNIIGHMAKPLALFMISFSIVFVAFAIVGFLVFGVQSANFKNFIRTLVTQTSIVLGDFDFEEMENINRILGRVYFFGFMYFVVMYLMNMFMAIINETYSDVKEDNDKQENEYEMVGYIIERFKSLIIKKRAPPPDETSSHYCITDTLQLYLPSDYKHWEDSESSDESEDESSKKNAFDIVRCLSRLSKDIDHMGERLEEVYKDRLSTDKTLFMTVLKAHNIHLVD